MELAGGVRVELVGDFSSLLLVVAPSLTMRLLLSNVVFGGLCSVTIWTLVYGAHLHLQHQQFAAIILHLLYALLFTIRFGSTKWVGDSQRRPLPTFVHVQYKNGIGICLVKVSGSYNPNLNIHV